MAEISITPTKACTKCGAHKPATEEFFHREGQGLKGKCRPCRLASARERWADKLGAEWRANHAADPNKRNSVAKAWRDANRDKCAEYGRRRHAKNMANPTVRLSRNISCRLRQSIVGGKSGRSWESILGYTVEELKVHLERQFSKGMTWSNYGEWHIDHIVPIASFGFTSPDDPGFNSCWALSNLRPLWAADNIRKADKRVCLL